MYGIVLDSRDTARSRQSDCLHRAGSGAALTPFGNDLESRLSRYELDQRQDGLVD
jgi:hypothetical protein